MSQGNGVISQNDLMKKLVNAKKCKLIQIYWFLSFFPEEPVPVYGRYRGSKTRNPFIHKVLDAMQIQACGCCFVFRRSFCNSVLRAVDGNNAYSPSKSSSYTKTLSKALKATSDQSVKKSGWPYNVPVTSPEDKPCLPLTDKKCWSMIATGNPSVAILLETFNCKRFLEAQLDSLESQTVRHWRLYVCDDGSTDATLDIIHRY